MHAVAQACGNDALSVVDMSARFRKRNRNRALSGRNGKRRECHGEHRDELPHRRFLTAPMLR